MSQSAISEARSLAGRADAAAWRDAVSLSVQAEARTPQPLPAARRSFNRAVGRIPPIRLADVAREIGGEDAGTVAWSPAGDRIATGGAEGFVRVWDTTTWQLVHEFDHGRAGDGMNAVFALSWSTTGRVSPLAALATSWRSGM